MRTAALVALVLLPFGCSKRPNSDASLPQTVVGDIGSRKPRFVFVAPDGFLWNDEYRIWHNKATQTSVKLAHEPGATFESTVDDFEADRMLAFGMELTKKETREINGRPTLLVHGNRLNAPFPEQFCTVAFGTSDGCAQITAIYPTNGTDQMKMQIETSLLESRYEVPD
ncbi:MAG: hypothetical protein MUD03_07480 [Pirellula sp.]|nr:hypothetical protein [Pirellula sp.]